MKIRAEQKNSRQAPRKVRLIANQVKDLPLEEAFQQLALIERKAALVILKTLRQAVANADHNHQLKFEDLEIDKILVKTGPTYKRWRAVSRGRAHRILKRTTHVEVVLKTKDQAEEPAKETAKKISKKQKTKAKKANKTSSADKSSEKKQKPNNQKTNKKKDKKKDK